MSHLYDCVRNKNFGKPFKFVQPLKFLSSNTQLIQAEPTDGLEVAKDGTMTGVERPRCKKKSKADNKQALKGAKKATVYEGISDAAGCMNKIH